MKKKSKVKSESILQFTDKELRDELERREEEARHQQIVKNQEIIDYIRKHKDILLPLAEMIGRRSVEDLQPIIDGELDALDIEEFCGLIAYSPA